MSLKLFTWSKLRKPIIYLTLALSILFAILVLAISPIAEYFIEKNSVEWTGRKIEMRNLSINLLKLSITIDELCIFEKNSTLEFFKSKKIHTSLSLSKLLKGEYHVKTLELVSPKLRIVQNGNQFNFDDLIEKFASDTTETAIDTAAEPTKYSIEDIKLSNGIIHYCDKKLNQTIDLQELSINCPQYAYNISDIKTEISFALKSGGSLKTTLNLNLNSMAYSLLASVRKLNLSLLNPNLKDILKTSYFGGYLTTDLLVKGDLDTPEALQMKGDISISKLRIDDETKTTVASWDDFSIGINKIDVANNIYDFGKIQLNKPTIVFEMYEKSDNFSQMMAPSEAEVVDSVIAEIDEINYSNPFTIMAGYIKQMSKDYIISNYTAELVELKDGHILYKDYTLEDKFVYDLEKICLQSARIDSKSDELHFTLTCLANRQGILNADLAFDPRDYMNMTINYSISKMRISDFNPYSKFYVAHAFVDGTLFYESNNTIRNGKLKSSNLMSIKKIEVSKIMKKKPLAQVPLRLAIAILRDVKGNIEFDIPVEGDLNDPNYKLGKVIWKIIKNLLIKAATAPFNLIANTLGTNADELKIIRFDYLQNHFEAQQLKNLNTISKVLIDKPELNVRLTQIASHEVETELLAIKLAKEAYYKIKIHHNSKDSLELNDYQAIEEISNKDSLFNEWLNEQLLPENTANLPSQLKCRKYIGEDVLKVKVDDLFSKRNKALLEYLIFEKNFQPNRIRILNTADEKSAEFESTPKYNVEFFVDE